MSENLAVEIVLLAARSVGVFLAALALIFLIRRIARAIMPVNMPNDDDESL